MYYTIILYGENMICKTCSTLSFTFTTRRCVRCSGTSKTNLSILCDTCSNADGICSICLKKTDPNSQLKKEKRGCRCGSK